MLGAGLQLVKEDGYQILAIVFCRSHDYSDMYRSLGCGMWRKEM
jgi:hypothetical protein